MELELKTSDLVNTGIERAERRDLTADRSKINVTIHRRDQVIGRGPMTRCSVGPGCSALEQRHPFGGPQRSVEDAQWNTERSSLSKVQSYFNSNYWDFLSRDLV